MNILQTQYSELALKSLCYYDNRNPNHVVVDEDYIKKIDCHCDNCFYGRTELAQAVIDLIDNSNHKQS